MDTMVACFVLPDGTHRLQIISVITGWVLHSRKNILH